MHNNKFIFIITTTHCTRTWTKLQITTDVVTVQYKYHWHMLGWFTACTFLRNKKRKSLANFCDKTVFYKSISDVTLAQQSKNIKFIKSTVCYLQILSGLWMFSPRMQIHVALIISQRIRAVTKKVIKFKLVFVPFKNSLRKIMPEHEQMQVFSFTVAGELFQVKGSFTLLKMNDVNSRSQQIFVQNMHLMCLMFKAWLRDLWTHQMNESYLVNGPAFFKTIHR